MKKYFEKLPLLISIVFFIIFSLAFLFLYKEISNNNSKAEQDMITWEKEARRREDIISLDRLLSQTEGDRAQLEAHFAQSSDIVPFLDTIEKLAPKVGASAQVNSVDSLPDNAGLVVGLKTSGSFGAIYKFLTLLENSPYELDFLSMDLHKLEASAATDKNVKGASWEAIFKIQLLSFVP